MKKYVYLVSDNHINNTIDKLELISRDMDSVTVRDSKNLKRGHTKTTHKISGNELKAFNTFRKAKQYLLSRNIEKRQQLLNRIKILQKESIAINAMREGKL